MIVRGANGSYEFIDFREKAPAAAFQVGFQSSFEAFSLHKSSLKRVIEWLCSSRDFVVQKPHFLCVTVGRICLKKFNISFRFSYIDSRITSTRTCTKAM